MSDLSILRSNVGPPIDLEALRRRLLGNVRRVCPAWLANQAEDITQEALLKVFNVLQREGESDRDLPASYIYKVAYHATIDAIRRQQQQRLNEASMDDGIHDVAGRDDPEADSSDAELARGVRACLQQMKGARLRATALRLQGHSVPEVASIMAWSKTQANNLVFRGMKDLRTCLDKKGLTP